MTDSEIIEPSIDPKTKKIAIRHVRASNDGGMRTRIQVRDFDPVFTDEPASLGGSNSAPSALETVLVALVGCDGVIFNGVARAKGFAYAGVEFECQSQIDVRGPKGVPGIRPNFETVDLKIVLYTDEPAHRVAQLQKNVEFRCPVMNLLRPANVHLTARWIVHPAMEHGR